jgi:hypothetical protein
VAICGAGVVCFVSFAAFAVAGVVFCGAAALVATGFAGAGCGAGFVAADLTTGFTAGFTGAVTGFAVTGVFGLATTGLIAGFAAGLSCGFVAGGPANVTVVANKIAVVVNELYRKTRMGVPPFPAKGTT